MTSQQQELRQLLDGLSAELDTVRRDMTFPSALSDPVKLAHLIKATRGLLEVVSLQQSFIETITTHLTRGSDAEQA